MRHTKRRPVTVGQMLTMEFLAPMGIFTPHVEVEIAHEY